MGKGTDLWDDSALITAFDHAMATYRAMHRESYPANPLEEEKNTSESNQGEPIHAESWTRQIEHDHGENNVLKDVTETYLPCHKNAATAEGGLRYQEDSLVANICPTESNPYSLDFPIASAEINNYNDQQSTQYSDLLKQYYELEEQMQKVLQQLQQTNYWNNQNPVQSGEYQPEQVPANNASESCAQPPCTLCSCHCLPASLISASACAIYGPSFGGYYCCPQNCTVSLPQNFSGGHGHIQSSVCSVGTSCTVDPSKQTTHPDDRAIRIGKMAAEKVLSSVKTEISLDSNNFEEMEKGKDKEEVLGEDECKASRAINQETDLAVVLSAWYTAGFHTGRYLSEQSRRKASQ